jgi:hypothetical protein
MPLPKRRRGLPASQDPRIFKNALPFVSIDVLMSQRGTRPQVDLCRAIDFSERARTAHARRAFTHVKKTAGHARSKKSENVMLPAVTVILAIDIHYLERASI